MQTRFHLTKTAPNEKAPPSYDAAPLSMESYRSTARPSLTLGPRVDRDQPFFLGLAEVFFFSLAGLAFFGASLLGENGGMMSEPLSAEATAVFFGASGVPLVVSGGDGSGAPDPTRVASVASAAGTFASGLLPPHAAVSAKRNEKPTAVSARVPEDRIT